MEAHFTCARFGETSLFGKVTPRAGRYLDRRSSGMGMYRIDRSHLKMNRLHVSEVPLDGSKVFIPGVERLHYVTTISYALRHISLMGGGKAGNWGRKIQDRDYDCLSL
ncbi:hypothetical protein [Syntrophorhabdus aromaticivorans]|uniref:hypothetical protein n=1 Tax=Syntrophorhabdus aromaticivorans TaxID=328301 RepID=UPI0003F58711|nr:hypothetical protein [Syntrophorhabdus aromaticivorans]